jgi:adenylate kinase
MPVHLVLIGPPGCGKGTQATRIAERYAIPHISTGAILRGAVRAGSTLGREVEATLARGALVSDAVMTELVRERLGAADVVPGFVLDGFPRTVVQARALDGMIDAETLTVALIAVSAEEIARRLGIRRICEACGITQAGDAAADTHSDPCPYCGGNLVRRQDDNPDTVRHRLETYHEFARPIIEYYETRRTYAAVDGAKHPDEVTTALRSHIDHYRG